MTSRAKSWLGGLLGAAGVFAFFSGALFPGLSWLAWLGALVTLAGLALVIAAVVGVTREIGGNLARFEAMLRAESPPPALDKKKESPP